MMSEQKVTTALKIKSQCTHQGVPKGSPPPRVARDNDLPEIVHDSDIYSNIEDKDESDDFIVACPQ